MMKSRCKLFEDSDDDEVDDYKSPPRLFALETSSTPLTNSTSKKKRKLRDLCEYSSDEDCPATISRDLSTNALGAIPLAVVPNRYVAADMSEESAKEIPSMISRTSPLRSAPTTCRNESLATSSCSSRAIRVIKESTLSPMLAVNSIDESCRPRFLSDPNQIDEPLQLRGLRPIDKSRALSMTAEVNQFAARYLFDHQIAGVDWMWRQYCAQRGSILGDDMGMGKTIQVAAFLLALFDKTGSISDMSACRHRKRYGFTASTSRHSSDTESTQVVSKLPLCLIVCPASLQENWNNELTKWGYFLIETLAPIKGTEDVVSPIARAFQGKLEILLTSYDRLVSNIAEISKIDWTVIVLDEAHQLKNSKTKAYEAVAKLSKTSWRLGLTGTPIQNRLEELWALLYLINNSKFMGWVQFKDDFDTPIKRGLSSKACPEAIANGQRRSVALNRLLASYMLQRGKELLAGESGLLKGKNDFVVLCDLTDLQSRLYQYVLGLPDFDNVKHYSDPCPCGKPQPIPSRSSSVQFHPLSRATCCEKYRVPLSEPSSDVDREIDPRAVVWRQNHPQNAPCPKCPTCILLPCLTKLVQIASHPGLLQETAADSTGTNHNSPHRFASINDEISDTRDVRPSRDPGIVFVKDALPPDMIAELGGTVQPSRFQEACRPNISGKMLVLQRMLQFFTGRGDKVLVFSYSTRAMDLIERFIKGSGWIYRRLDGGTPVNKRQKLVDEFNSKSLSVQIFLSSSKAGGLGLNLASASKVIIFDVHWNPSVDLQSQDRAYRIGQTENVSVFRLVSKGTVEEVIYMRQLYKQELQKVVLQKDQPSTHPISPLNELDNPLASHSCYTTHQAKGSRNFEGVEGDTTCRGELFGIQNLMQFSPTSILEALRSKFEEEVIDEIDSHMPESELFFECPKVVDSGTTESPFVEEAQRPSEFADGAPADTNIASQAEQPIVHDISELDSSSARSTVTSNTEIKIPSSRVFATSRRQLTVRDVFREALPSRAALDYIRRAIDSNDLHLLGVSTTT